MSQSTKRVFLSYGRNDALEVTSWLYEALTSRGYQVFWDVEALRDGTEWDRHLEEAIRTHDVVIALMSPHSVRTEGECRHEISFAKENRKPVIPVMVRQCERPLRIHDLQYVDLEAFPRVGDDVRSGWLEKIIDFIENGVPDDPFYSELRKRFKPLDYERVLWRNSTDPFEGREWLIERIDNWLADPDAPSTLFVLGGPGVGKTSAMAHWCRGRAGVGAYHFCDHNEKEMARDVVGSLSGQLLSLQNHNSYPEALRVLETPNLEASGNGNSGRDWTAVEWFRKLILNPLRHNPPEALWLIVIDALDEAVPEIQNLFSVCHQELPDRVRLLITSRPESNMISWFRNPLVIDATSSDNLVDLERYVARRLELIIGNSTPDTDKFVQLLLSASNGSFLYCSEVLDSVESGHLKVSSVAVLPPGLGGVYIKYLDRCFPNISEEQKNVLRILLETLLVAKELLDNRTLSELTGLALNDVNEARRSLGSLLSDGKHWRFFHKSFEDWLKTDSNNPLSVDLISGHETIANKLLSGNGTSETLKRYRLRWLAAHLIDLAKGTKDLCHFEAACELLTNFHELKSRVIMDVETPSGNGGFINSIGEIIRDLEALVSEAYWNGWSLPQQVKTWQGLFLRYRELWSRYPGDFHQDCVNLFSQVTDDVVPPIESRPWLQVLNQQAIDHIKNCKYLFRDSSCASFSPREHIVAIGGSDGALRLVETVTGALLWFKKVHVSKIHTVSISQDGKRVLTASDDNMVCLWSTDTGEIVRYLRDHNASIVTATFSTDGRFVLTTSEDSEIRIWAASDGQAVNNFIDRMNVIGKSNISSDGQMLVSVLDDHKVRILKVVTGEVINVLKGHQKNVVTALFSPDDSQVLTYSDDKTARIWDVQTGDEVQMFLHSSPVRCAGLNSDGSRVVTASERSIKIWSVTTGRCVRTFVGHTQDVTYVAFDKDCTYVISVAEDRTVRIWDIANEELINTFRGHWGNSTTCSFSHDSSLVLSTSSAMTRVWDLKRQSLVSGMHDEQIKFVIVSPDGSHVLSASDDGIVKVWDASDFSSVSTIVATGVPFKSVIFSPCGRRILTAAIDKTVSVWDRATGDLICTAGKLGDLTDRAVYSPCGSTFLTLHNEVVKLWDLNCNVIADLVSDDEFDDGAFVDASYSPDGRYIVTASRDGTSKVWCAASGALVVTFEHDQDLTSASFDSGNRHLITTSVDCTAKLWDFDTGTLSHTFKHDCVVEYAIFSPDGKYAVTLTRNNWATIWDCTDGTKVHVIRNCFKVESALDSEELLLSIMQKNSEPNKDCRKQLLYKWKDGFQVRDNDPKACITHPTLLDIGIDKEYQIYSYTITVREAMNPKAVTTHLESPSRVGCAKILPNDPQSFVVGSQDGTVRFFRLQGGDVST